MRQLGELARVCRPDAAHRLLRRRDRGSGSVACRTSARRRPRADQVDAAAAAPARRRSRRGCSGVPAAYFHGRSLYSTRSGRHLALGDHVAAVEERAAPAPAGAPWRRGRRRRTAPASCGRRRPGSPRRAAVRRRRLLGTSWAASTSSSDPRCRRRLPVAARVGDRRGSSASGGLVPRKFDAPVTADQLGALVDQLREVVEVELARAVVEAGDPALDAAAEPRQDLAAQAVPRHEVRVVLHHRGHDVVAVAELGEQRVHHRVDRLGRVPVRRDAAPARAR